MTVRSFCRPPPSRRDLSSRFARVLTVAPRPRPTLFLAPHSSLPRPPSSPRAPSHPAPQLLNTVSNLGGTWPKFFVLKGIDRLSLAVCHVHSSPSSSDSGPSPLDLVVRSAECVSDHGNAACAALGGECLTERDGYYAVSAVCIALGAALLLWFVGPVARKLQGAFGALPRSLSLSSGIRGGLENRGG